MAEETVRTGPGNDRGAARHVPSGPDTLSRVLSLVLIAVAVVCVVSAVVSVSSMGSIYGLLPGASDVLYYFYQINGFFSLFAAALGVSVLRGRAQKIPARVCLWALLLLCVMFVTPFVTETAAYLGQASFAVGFQYLCAYLPFFALAAELIALLSTGVSARPGVLPVLSLVCALVSVFCCVDYLWELVPALGDTESYYDFWRVLGMLSGFACVTVAAVLVWCITRSGRVFISACGETETDTGADGDGETGTQEAADTEDIEGAAPEEAAVLVRRDDGERI